MTIVAFATAIGAQFKINPFQEDLFRIGLGVSIFLFFLLMMPHLSYVKTGILTGIVSFIFQSIDWLVQTSSPFILDSMLNNLGAGLYYIAFAYALGMLKGRLHISQPLLIGGWITAIDFGSNILELLVRGVLSGTNVFHLREWLYLLVVAGLRSYFVTGLYNSISIRQMRLIHAEQEKRIEQMLNVNSGLYGEVFYLQKAMNTIEEITAASYELYRELQASELRQYSQRTLGIAQQIHEVKKDSQRILAGLVKLYDREKVVHMSLTEMLDFAIKGNLKYSEMLGKNVHIHKEQQYDCDSPHYIALLTVMNNLIANAVEAIDDTGDIRIQVLERIDDVYFIVTDSGKGIPESKQDVIFEPGYTTKYNEAGIAATGIGLSHVRDIVHSMGGRITVDMKRHGRGTTFVSRLPKASIMKEGSANEAFYYNRG